MGDSLREDLCRAGLIQRLAAQQKSELLPLVQPSAQLDLTDADRVMLKTFRISAD